VGQAPCQLPDRLQFVSLNHGLLSRALFADIARDLGEADQVPVSVSDRIDDDVRPKLGSILAQPPSLTLEATVGFSDPERLFRETLCAVFLGIEGREVATDDLGLGISFQPLRSRVPTRDVAAGSSM